MFCLAYILLFAFYIFQENSIDVPTLLRKAANNDKTAFATEYLREAFSYWQKHYDLKSFKVDTLFEQEGNDEIWLSNLKSKQFDNYKIALLVSKEPQQKIIDVRRLLITNNKKFEIHEKEVLECVERFVWVYDIGVENFIYDFLFPNYIKLRYEGILNNKKILKKLRSRFKYTLPIQSIEWEGKGDVYSIRLVLDSPLKPLEMQVNIKSYITSRYFELEDKRKRVSALVDSIKVWQSFKYNTTNKPD